MQETSAKRPTGMFGFSIVWLGVLLMRMQCRNHPAQP
jgi:hypothetical protein